MRRLRRAAHRGGRGCAAEAQLLLLLHGGHAGAARVLRGVRRLRRAAHRGGRGCATEVQLLLLLGSHDPS